MVGLGLACAGLCGPVAYADTSFEWEELPELPQPMSGQFVGVHNNALILAGGTYWPVSPFQGGTKVWLDTVYVFEPGAEAWKKAESFLPARAYGAAVCTSEGVVCAGGADSQAHYADAFRLRWLDGGIEQTPLPALPGPCAYTSAALVGSTMYVAGGQEAPDSTEALRNFWSLDVSKPDGEWQELEPWPGPARILPVVAAQVVAFRYWTASMGPRRLLRPTGTRSTMPGL